MSDPARPFTVSVVIPLFNKETAVECTVRSVLDQTRKPDEIIIVDDGSTDRSVTAVRGVLSKARTQIPVRLFEQANEGVSVARNRGAKEARFDYIAFLDADDEWLPNYLVELERLGTACPAASVLTIGYGRLNRRGEMIPEPTALPDGFFGIVDDFYDVYRRGYGIAHTSSVAIRRDAWERGGGFPIGARKSQDMALWLKLALTESFAHSSACLSIWHEEFSGVGRRKGAIPQHFVYFLGTDEGRSNLHNRALARFLGSNLMVQIASHRVAGDWPVVAELRRLSGVLPLSGRMKSFAASSVPLPLLRVVGWWRRRSRELRL
jgi:glycosyltransferase involved in cell wall biosynthesis